MFHLKPPRDVLLAIKLCQPIGHINNSPIPPCGSKVTGFVLNTQKVSSEPECCSHVRHQLDNNCHFCRTMENKEERTTLQRIHRVSSNHESFMSSKTTLYYFFNLVLQKWFCLKILLMSLSKWSVWFYLVPIFLECWRKKDDLLFCIYIYIHKPDSYLCEALLQSRFILS